MAKVINTTTPTILNLDMLVSPFFVLKIYLIFIRKSNLRKAEKKTSKGAKSSLEASHRHLLDSSFHNSVQKVTGWVLRLISD